MYYTYLLRCADHSIYTGITTDLARRMQEHFSASEKCAKYTLRHKPEKLEMAWESETRVLASKLEFYIKKNLTKKQKEALIQAPEKLKEFLGEKIESSAYCVTDLKKCKQ